MDYNQPYGGAANAPYVNGNPASGVQGSIPPGPAIEFPQREIVAAAKVTGQTPSNSDLTQLAQALSIGLYMGTFGGTANALTATIPGSVVFPALRVGMMFYGFTGGSPNTAAPTLNLSGFTVAPGVKNIVRSITGANTPLLAGDLPANALVSFRWDGVSFRHVGIVPSEILALTGTVTRTRLVATTTYYVSPSGSDSNDGKTVGTPFATRQKAWNTIVNAIDLNGQSVIVQLADGTYTDSFIASSPAVGNSNGVGAVLFRGNVTTPANVLIATTGSNSWLAQAGAQFSLDSMKIQTAGANTIGIAASVGAIISYSNIVFGSCVLAHVAASSGGCVQQTGPVTIVSGAAIHCSASGAGSNIAISNQSITLTGTPTFSSAFAQITGPSYIVANALTISGGAHGPAYYLSGNGVLYLNGQALPGDAAATVASGGQVL
jgi:hypothetical protein